MRFLNALAWVLLIWSTIAIVVPALFTITETNAMLYVVRLQHFNKVFWWRACILTVSLLWLIFG